MKWIKILECPYCGNRLEEDSNYCCKEAGHGQWVEVCANCYGHGAVRRTQHVNVETNTITNSYATCIKCKGTGGRNE